MMQIPLWLLIHLPKSVQEWEIKRRWAAKGDDEILTAYHSCRDWIGAASSKYSGDAMKAMAAGCQQKLDSYVLPEIKRRGLDVES